MKSNKYQIAIVGYGFAGGFHGELLKTLDMVDVAGVYDISKERWDAAQEKGLNTFNTLEELLADESIDIVIISTPNYTHKDIAVKALRAGKNVICEKPVALNCRQLQEMLDVANENGKLFVVHQNRRWDEDFLAVKKIYDEKIIGNVFNIESRVYGSWGIPGNWRKFKAYGGGMLFDWGVHLVDQITWLINEKITSVFCRLSHITTDDVDDGFLLLLTFESSITALIEVGTFNSIRLPRWYILADNGAAVIEDWEKNGKMLKIKVKGSHDSNAVLTAAGISRTMAPRSDDTVERLNIPDIHSDVRDFYRNVLDAIEGKAEIIVKNQQVMRNMKIIEAAFLSDKLNQVVKFE
jgi:predicted dehydrogenase